jgi:DNA-binding CsgD family transcriptional regulator
MAGVGAFVGREGELSRLRLALSERVRLVLVVGDAGIGKTAFVREGLAHAAVHGMTAVGGGCLPLAGKLPLLPVADALVELSQLNGGEPFEAALTAAPPYVRAELARVVPKLADAQPEAVESAKGWRHERLFAGLTELLDGVARRFPLGLLIEDVHWADGTTLDFLTYLVRPSRASAVPVVVTCRSDEVPLDPAVVDWLTHVRRDAGTVEIRLGPLSRGEAVEQITALVETAPPSELVEEVYARTEGHPFFTEQLVTAAATDTDGLLAGPVVLPARLIDLLNARTARCGADARAVLAALAVAGRPLTVDMLVEVNELDLDRVRAAVQELTSARLLTPSADRGHRLRHALLAEAVATELPPSERVSLHERVARVLEATGAEELAAEAAGHWAAAGRSGAELRARITAAQATERMFAYADAATHWQRAIELFQTEPDVDIGDEIDLPRLYIRAVDALEASGNRARARVVVEEAYRKFADHPDRATAALVQFRAGYLRAGESPAAGLPLMSEALRLSEGIALSPEHARVRLQFALDFLWVTEGRQPGEIRAALESGLEAADLAGTAAVTTPILCLLAAESFLRGEVEEGFRLLDQARSVLGTSRDAWAVLWLAIVESDALLKVGKLEEATLVGLRGFDQAQNLGFGSSGGASICLANAVEGLLDRGRTTEAATLIDPLTIGSVDPVNWPLHACRVEIDLRRGEVDAAADRLTRIDVGASLEFARDFAELVGEVVLWVGQPERAFEAIHRALDRRAELDWMMKCGWLLAVGMRACADLTEMGRARGDETAVQSVLGAVADLVSWLDRARGVPFTNHPYIAVIPASRATWEAERSRATGASDPDAWSVAAVHWEAVGYQHRAGYARWRQAEALLATPHGHRTEATAALSTAAVHAVQHVPLLTAIQDLARRARMDLAAPGEPARRDEPAPVRALGLTDRELAVLRLLGEGKTNREIAAALYISPRTVGVHVSSILRKLGATTRVQAATLAERAGVSDL